VIVKPLTEISFEKLVKKLLPSIGTPPAERHRFVTGKF